MQIYYDEIEKFIKRIPWHILSNVYGNSHNTIIGLIALEWIKEKGNSVFEACPKCNGKYPDILLNKNNEIFAVVEVETSVKKYIEKLNNLKEFYHGYHGVKFTILIALNDNYGDSKKKKYTHYWDEYISHSVWGDTNISKRISVLQIPVLIISLEKKKAERISGYLGELRNRHNFGYNVCNIEYCIYNDNGIIYSNGVLWKE